MKKTLIIGLLGLGVLVAAGVGFLVSWGNDIPPPLFPELIPEYLEVPPEQNAFTHYSAAANACYWPTNRVEADAIMAFLTSNSVENAALLEVLDGNREAFEWIAKGAACDVCRAPDLPDFTALVPYVPPWLQLSRALALRSACERTSGRHDEAAKTCILLLRFGNHVHSTPQSLIQYLVGLAIVEFGLVQTRALLQEQELPTASLEALRSALQSLNTGEAGLVRSMQCEYALAEKVAHDFASGKISLGDVVTLAGTPSIAGAFERAAVPAYMFQPNRTLQIFGECYMNLITNAPRTAADVTLIDPETIAGLNTWNVGSFLRPNAAGRVLVATLMPALQNVLSKRHQTECSVSATRLLAALELHRRQHGNLPENLAALVPHLLEEVPRDPYDGAPFRYLRAEGVVYSVGTNLVDDAGSTNRPPGSRPARPEDAHWAAEDIVFPCSLPGVQPGASDRTERKQP